ncbi:MAG: hypothetical protein ACLQLH_13280 [Terracidiphilus sp.]
MSKPTKVIVLCEDNRTFSFMRSYLKRCGIQRDIRPVISPRGSAFTFVVNSFPAQVNAYRLTKARIHTWLIAVVDADTGTVAQRIGELDRGLTQAQEPRVRAMRIQDERIARLVPRRNIETWILALNDVVPVENPPLNETTDYKKDVQEFRHYDWEGIIKPASTAFYGFIRPNAQLPANLLESLRHGICEMRRVEELAG